MIVEKIKSDKFVCKRPSITVVTFDSIFELVAINVINTVYNMYGNVNHLEKLNKDIKRIFIHFLLEQIYKRMILEKDTNVILYINTSFTTKTNELWNYTDQKKIERFIIRECKIIADKAPLPMYVEADIIDLTDDCGETREVMNKLYKKLRDFKQQITSLNKLKKYSKDNGLMQFMNNYHHETDNKNNWFYHKYLKGVHK